MQQEERILIYEKYLQNLPVIPSVAAQIINLTSGKTEISFKTLEETISRDPFLSSKILRVANSATYARQREITTIKAAITLLGFKTIRSLVILLGATSLFSRDAKTFFYQHFWRHSLLTAFIVLECADKTYLKAQREELFIAGLLHDIGQAALYSHHREEYEELILRRGASVKSFQELERDYLGLDHKEIGGSVLEKWHFPELFVASAKEHGTLNVVSRHKSALYLITLADILAVLIVHQSLTKQKQELLERIPSLLNLDQGVMNNLIEVLPKTLQENRALVEYENLIGLKT